jgi:hypothetical protein
MTTAARAHPLDLLFPPASTRFGARSEAASFAAHRRDRSGLALVRGEVVLQRLERALHSLVERDADQAPVRGRLNRHGEPNRARSRKR